MKAKTSQPGFYCKMFYVNRLFILFVFLISCNSKTPYSIVTFNGKGPVFNSSKSNIWMSSVADSLHSVSLLAENNDLIMINDNLILFKDEMGKSFSYKSYKSFGYVNGKINLITLSNEKELLSWFRQMKETDIENLEVLVISDTIPMVFYPYLEQISKTKPHVGICVDVLAMPALLKYFTPSFLLLENVKQSSLYIFNEFKNLETLSISLEDSLYSIALPAMPRLKQLIISEVSEKQLIGTDFLKNNPQIEHLVLMAKDSLDIAFIKSVVNIKQLTISGFEKLSGISVIENFKNLETLCLIGGNISDLSVINKLKELRWLALPANTSQEEFESIVENHRNLEVLEIIKNQNIHNFKALRKLSKLMGLAITDTITDYPSLLSFKQLKYLSVPGKFAKDSIKMVNLCKSLPDCVVVTNEGFCLGSGWLLLLFPFILVFVVFFKKRIS